MKMSSLGFVHEKNIQRGFNLLFEYMWTQNADPSFHRTPSLWTWRNESKLSALEFCLHIWLEARIRTSEPVVMREDSCFSFGSARASSWTCYEGRQIQALSHNPFLFCIREKTIKRHNAFFFLNGSMVFKAWGFITSYKHKISNITSKTWLIRWKLIYSVTYKKRQSCHSSM